MKETNDNEQFEQNDEENAAEDINQTEQSEKENESMNNENETEKNDDKEDGGEWEELHRIFSDMVENAYRIHGICYEKLRECYQKRKITLPMDLFLEEFDSYIEEIEEHPILMDDWIEHLSGKAEIPNYQLINGYQYIKFIAYQYYKENLSKKVRGKDYRNLYNL